MTAQTDNRAPDSIPPEVVERREEIARTALERLHEAVKAVSSHFDAPLDGRTYRFWQELDASQKEAARVLGKESARSLPGTDAQERSPISQHILDGDLRITADSLHPGAEPQIVPALYDMLDRRSAERRASIRAFEIGLRGSFDAIDCHPTDAQVSRCAALTFDRVLGNLIGYANDMSGIFPSDQTGSGHRADAAQVVEDGPGRPSEPLSEGQWRPIAEAPKDIKPIIAWDGHVRQWVRWMRDWQLGEGWFSSESGKFFEATHWQPLPDPPRDQPPEREDSREAISPPRDELGEGNEGKAS